MLNVIRNWDNTPEKASDYCLEHPDTKSVLIAQHEMGLKAIQLPGVEAVIFPEDHQSDKAAFRKQAVQQPTDVFSLLYTGMVYNYNWRSRSPIKSHFMDKDRIISSYYTMDWDNPVRSFCGLYRRSSSVNNSRVTFLSNNWTDYSDEKKELDSITSVFHSDPYSYRMNYYLRGGGLEWIAQKLTDADKRHISQRDFDVQRRLVETFNVVRLDESDTVIFKGNQSDVAFWHRTPLPENGVVRFGLSVDSQYTTELVYT